VLPQLLCGVNSDAVNHIFHGTEQVKVYQIKVWWPLWPWHRNLGTRTNRILGIKPI
jgi:hypothetical protein